MPLLLDKIKIERPAMYKKYESLLFKKDDDSKEKSSNGTSKTSDENSKEKSTKNNGKNNPPKDTSGGQPVIFTAFANPQDNLNNLIKEQNGIQDALRDIDQQGKIRHILRTDTEFDAYFDFMTTFQNQIYIFHFAGHANNEKLSFQNAQAFFKPLAEELVARNPQSLKLVFLNGCSTLGHVKILFDLSVPSVIATSAKIDDSLAMNFAVRFYKNLSNGDDIAQAYRSAAHYVKGTSQAARFRFLGSIKRWSELLDNIDQTEDFPWGLYTMDETNLRWKIIEKNGEATEPKSEPKKEPRSEPKKEPESEPKKEPESESETETKSEPKKEPESEPKKEPESEPKKEPKSESETETKSEPKKEPKSESETETKSEPKKEPKSESEFNAEWKLEMKEMFSIDEKRFFDEMKKILKEDNDKLNKLLAKQRKLREIKNKLENEHITENDYGVEYTKIESFIFSFIDKL